ncbi:acetyl/propionyl/methylcrotonyl-CoA carboxylase subunit alpha [Corynebacterium sp. TAE3-ERU12]|uniref:acetyl/propionyl/methylcrotonyl-CoA carboxylase subunit alpha n=1 Tax=Corynebacterium sp. TAE3-ERU12 TaxID=2849491 RepID=UPI001C469421|nr:acetyl/propionyl/methylcrotonyl-CoA carboxylase subunit alpha [Corynebacterium sp. TAE3-ERU12]MBV7294795.1 acetyl/propionyl/methylcrotonyl-CoA carboxylase subunit alpha [Corynebacterium sp. TAE3-ERU12]
MTDITTVLVANRGEIACRVIRTLREQGVRSVAVYSDADADAQHVRMADIAVRIGPPAARESYLLADVILDAARRTGAQAIHPGYGFLSENASFSRACADAGIIFMGPSGQAIETMGDKISARAAVEARDVPTVPGISRPGLTDEELVDAAAGVGFPVLIKPSAGGGGKGMHRVEDPKDLPEALRTARREAASSFGDDALFLEHFVDTPRHIEVQILADTHGNVVHLGERECSLQRRHQKVIEEAPSPLLTEKIRQDIGGAACDAARSVGYVGAGTVEFIVPANEPEKFYFMEMNTRLQVEHPVTEEVTGLDLVALQLAIARGEKLPITQDGITLTGHSVEARVYAEDPEAGFLPTGGTIHRVIDPTGAGVRVDSGIADGTVVSSLYDPMLMKVITHGADREEALERMDQALAKTVVAGVTVNTDFCRYLLKVPDVASGDLDTGLLDRVADGYVRSKVPDSALVAAAMTWLSNRWPQNPTSPWQVPDAWRPGHTAAQRLRLAAAGESTLISITGSPGRADVVVDDQMPGVTDEDAAEPRSYVATIHADGEMIRVDIDGVARQWQVEDLGTDIIVSCDEGAWVVHRENVVHSAADDIGGGDGVLRSPMPGTVIALSQENGAHVAEGDAVLVVEAMKMEHTLRAPFAGLVSYHCAEADQVSAEKDLATIEPDE